MEIAGIQLEDPYGYLMEIRLRIITRYDIYSSVTMTSIAVLQWRSRSIVLMDQSFFYDQWCQNPQYCIKLPENGGKTVDLKLVLRRNDRQKDGAKRKSECRLLRCLDTSV